MASLLLHSVYVPSVPGWGAVALVDNPLEAEWVRTLHSSNCDPMEPWVVCWSVIDSDRICTGG